MCFSQLKFESAMYLLCKSLFLPCHVATHASCSVYIPSFMYTILVHVYYCDIDMLSSLQLFYVGILAVTYGIIADSSFRYIPSYYVGEFHR